jgi:hypothetical protein
MTSLGAPQTGPVGEPGTESARNDPRRRYGQPDPGPPDRATPAPRHVIRSRRTPGHAGNQPAHISLDRASTTTLTGPPTGPPANNVHAPVRTPQFRPRRCTPLDTTTLHISGMRIQARRPTEQRQQPRTAGRVREQERDARAEPCGTRSSSPTRSRDGAPATHRSATPRSAMSPKLRCTPSSVSTADPRFGSSRTALPAGFPPSVQARLNWPGTRS